MYGIFITKAVNRNIIVIDIVLVVTFNQAIQNQCFEKLIIAVQAMQESSDIPIPILDVCHLIPGITREPWDEVPITLLAFAGYYGRQDMIDYLIQEGASKEGYIYIYIYIHGIRCIAISYTLFIPL